MTAQEAKNWIRPMLADKRYHHSLCVAKEAVRLAKRFGADPEKAELAGLLHDITKELPTEKQLKMMESFGIILTDVERRSRKVWHAMLGAAYLERECGVTDPDILGAVRWHTTGKAGMTLLEKIVYIADYIEPKRDKAPNLPQIRQLAFEDLNMALLRILEDTVEYLDQGDDETDDITRQTYEYYKNHI